MSNPPFMPIWVDDYIADTLHLATEQHGIYFLLMLHYWKKGGLPQEDEQLAHIVKLTPTRWAKNKPVIMALFQTGWTHKRIDLELKKASEKSAIRSSAGARGAEAKYLKNKNTALANAIVLPEQKGKQKPALALASSPDTRVDSTDEATASSSSTRPEKTNGKVVGLFDEGTPISRKKRIAAESDSALLDRMTDIWNPWAAERGLSQVQGLTDARASKLRQRMKYLRDLGHADDEAAFRFVLARAEESFFIKGSPRSPLKFDQLLRESFLIALLEGQYRYQERKWQR